MPWRGSAYPGLQITSPLALTCDELFIDGIGSGDRSSYTSVFRLRLDSLAHFDWPSGT